MKPLLIVANWKSNKSKDEVEKWLREFTDKLQKEQLNKEIIICPPCVYLPFCASFIRENNLPIKLGAQDVSSFPPGAHTGEVSASMLKDFSEFVIIGHSERRKNGDTEDVLAQKVKQAKEQNLETIYCLSDARQQAPQEVAIVAYDPSFAIGSGNPDTPENANNVAGKIRENKNVRHVLYGGSVTPSNVNGFTQMENIDGVLVGGASLDPHEFLEIINNA